MTWVTKQTAKLPNFPAITNRTAWTDDLTWLGNIVKFINFRSRLLRERAVNLDDSWTLDLEVVLAESMKPSQGLETGNAVLKNACQGAEQMLRGVLEKLGYVEWEEVWNWLNHCRNVVQDCIEREEDEQLAGWLDGARAYERLVEEVAAEPDQDAVWLQGLREVLEMDKDALDFWQRRFADHERIMFQALETAEDLNIKVGVRQAVVTQWFRPVEREETVHEHREPSRPTNAKVSGLQKLITEYFHPA